MGRRWPKVPLAPKPAFICDFRVIYNNPTQKTKKMIEIMIVVSMVILLISVVTYVFTIMPFFWAVLMKYTDRKIEEEVKKYLDAELAEKMKKIECADQEIRRREETVILLKRTVGRKLDRDEMIPIEITKYQKSPVRGIY